MNITFLSEEKTRSKWIFGLLFVLTLILYLPTAKGGWVIDAVGWIFDMKHHSFWDFINRTYSPSESFYQLFALHYFLFYKIWGMNMWAWSLLYITMHAINAYLLYGVTNRLCIASNVKYGWQISLAGAILFTICPHISEVLAWKACFHYLMGFMFILLITGWVQQYQLTQSNKYAWWAAVVFFLSVFGLEIFYLTPLFVLSIAVYYRLALGGDKEIFKKTIFRFFIPQLVVFCLYLIALYVVYNFIRPHKTDLAQSATEYLSKPIKYFLHIVLLVRYYPTALKDKLYELSASVVTIVIFYGTVISIIVVGFLKMKKLSGNAKLMLLLFILAMINLCFLMFVPFPGSELLVFYDRYTYFADGFIYTLLVMIVRKMAPRNGASFLFIYALVNVCFTVKVNKYWKYSGYVDDRLIRSLPPLGDKTIILLNLPENMNGVPMIGAQPSSKFRDTYEVFFNTNFKNKIYDAASYNMITMEDGAHVKVPNDSVIDVTLGQWGTWWWYEGHGAKSYETEDYKLNLVDPGHMYELTLRHPAGEYLLLFQVGAQWRTVDMSKKNVEQY